MKFENTLLLVDDDADDRAMLKEALKDLNVDHELIEAQDGMDALRKLQELSRVGKLPCLIVLDINMPKMDGRETFISIRNDSGLAKIPIVIFSTSDSMLDKTFFQHHNTAYFVKPINFTELKKTASRLINVCYHNANKSE